MFKYENFEEKHFIEFLSQGLLEEDISHVLNRFSLYSPRIQFEIIKYLRERSPELISLREFSNALGINQKLAREILQNPYYIGYIPLFKKDKAELGRFLLIKNTSKLYTNIPELKRYLFTIKRAVFQNFAVFFDKKFTGSSFMLPVAVALIVENLPKNLVFTGKIDQKGNIYEVNGIKEKLELCKNSGLKLILPLEFSLLSEIKNFFNRDIWHIPIYITSESKEEFSTFISFCKVNRGYIQRLKRIFEIPENFFVMGTKQLNEVSQWENTVLEFYKKWNFFRNFPYFKKKLFHIAIRGPSSLAMALGIIFGSQEPFIIYHYQRGEYFPIEVKDPREIKELTEDLNYTRYSFEKEGEELVIILQGAHHSALADVKKYISQRLDAPSFLQILPEKAGNIPIEHFKFIAKETASIIQKIRREHNFNCFHFFFVCPVAIAFMLGVAFGHYSQGFIYNYEKEEGSYKKIFSIKLLRNIREGNIIF